MQILSKLVLSAGAVQAVFARDDYGHGAATTSPASDLQGVEFGQLLATSCAPLTIYTHECHVVTVQPSTTSETMIHETSSEIRTPVEIDTATSEIIESFTTSEPVPEPTGDEVVSAACGQHPFYLELIVFLFGLCVLYTA